MSAACSRHQGEDFVSHLIVIAQQRKPPCRILTGLRRHSGKPSRCLLVPCLRSYSRRCVIVGQRASYTLTDTMATGCSVVSYLDIVATSQQSTMSICIKAPSQSIQESPVDKENGEHSSVTLLM